MTTSLLVALIFLQSALAKESEPKGIGLLLGSGEVVINKNSRHLRIGIVIPANITPDDAKKELDLIIKELTKYREIPGVRTVPAKATIVDALVLELHRRLEHLLQLIVTLGNMRNPAVEVRIEPYICQLTLPELTSDSIKQLRIDIAAIVAETDMATTDMTTAKIQELRDDVFKISSLIQSAKSTLDERKDIADALANNDIPDSLRRVLETQACIPDGNLETMHINFCDVDKLGFHCELDLAIYTTTEEYVKQVAVSYGGTQLTAERPTQTFVLDANKKLVLLDCGDYPVLPFNPDDSPVGTDLYCTITPYDNNCGTALEKNDYTNILSYCNFTNTKPELVTRTPVGLLIMSEGEQLIIKELVEGQNAKLSIPDKTPVLIISPYSISVSTKGLDMTFDPVFKTSERRLIYTSLPTDFIESMKKSAWKREVISSIGNNNLYIGASITIIIALLSSIGIIYCISQKCNISLGKTGKMLSKAGHKAYEAKNNYKQNKKLLSSIIKN